MKFGLAITIFMTCSIGLSTISTAQSRGMQTAAPRDTMNTNSPRTIDFTNPNAGTPVQKGTRQIPLQNLPFGERPRENFEQLWNQAEKQGKAKQSGNKMWPKFSNPFKRNDDDSKLFQFPSNLNRKPNYSNSTVLTDKKSNGFQMPELFKPKPFETPQWMTDMNQKTKDMFSFNKNKAQQQFDGAGNWAQKSSDDWREKSNQAWQKFSTNLNPKNWNNQGGQRNSVSPPLRQANNWQDSIQTKRR